MRTHFTLKPVMGFLATLALGSLATAQICPAADVFEPNDDCASASALAFGFTGDLSVEHGPVSNQDYFSFDVQPGEEATLDVLFSNAQGDLDVYLYDDAACTSQVAYGGSVTDNEQVSYENTTGAVVTITMKTRTWSGTCVDYALDLTSSLACPGDDAFEPNDDCASAAALPTGATGGLAVQHGPTSNQDFFVFTVQDGEIATLDMLFSNAQGDIDVYLYDDAACTNQVAYGGSVTDNEQVSYLNTSGAAVDVTMKTRTWSGTCIDYSLNLDIAVSTLVCPGADAFEPNDDCASATVMPVGTTDSLTVFGSANATPNDDFWSYSCANNEMVTIDVLFSDASGDIDVYLYDDAACTNEVDYGGSVTDDEQISYTNTSGAAVVLTMKTRTWGSFECNDYELVVSSVIDPCLSVAEDALAPNQDCASAAVVTDGAYTGLATFKATAEDYFRVDVPDGATINVDALFDTSVGDIDMELYESEADCIADINVDSSASTSDNENVSAVNTSGGMLTYYVHVYLWDNAGNEECNNYDLVVDIALPTMGTTMCVGDGSVIACPCVNESVVGAGEGCLNSMGYGAVMTATGSNSVAADDAVFHLSQASPGETSVLIQGTSTIAIPFKDGILCMGTYTRRVEFVTVDAAGEASTVGSIATQANLFAGQTRWYQFWYRDTGGVSPCGIGSNLSNGLEISWI